MRSDLHINLDLGIVLLVRVQHSWEPLGADVGVCCEFSVSPVRFRFIAEPATGGYNTRW